jgi:hypothetical protein
VVSPPVRDLAPRGFEAVDAPLTTTTWRRRLAPATQLISGDPVPSCSQADARPAADGQQVPPLTCRSVEVPAARARSDQNGYRSTGRGLEDRAVITAAMGRSRRIGA